MEVSIRSVNAFIMVLLFSVATASPTDRACEEPTTSELSSLLTSNIHETFDLARFSHIPATHDILNFRHINRSFLVGQTGCRNNRMSSDISEASSCPWHYELNYDENRRPETIAEAKCNCRHHRPCIGGMENSHCEPVKYNIRVLRKYGCENGKFLYKQTMERITVGCTCVVR